MDACMPPGCIPVLNASEISLMCLQNPARKRQLCQKKLTSRNKVAPTTSV